MQRASERKICWWLDICKCAQCLAHLTFFIAIAATTLAQKNYLSLPAWSEKEWRRERVSGQFESKISDHIVCKSIKWLAPQKMDEAAAHKEITVLNYHLCALFTNGLMSPQSLKKNNNYVLGVCCVCVLTARTRYIIDMAQMPFPTFIQMNIYVVSRCWPVDFNCILSFR